MFWAIQETIYGAPRESEIEKAASLLDYAEAA
jgi:hypothetical protein